MATALRAVELSTDTGRNRGSGEAPALALADNATIASGSPLMGWRGFHTELQRAAAAAVQTGAPLSLLMIELVRPGGIDQRGGAGRPAEPVGALAGLIKAAVGECGSLARYTERRLAVIMIETDLGGALARAEGIGRRLSSRPGGPAGAARPEPLPAIGIAQFRDDESLGHLIQRASDALGRAMAERSPAVVVDRGVKARPARASGAHRLTLAPTPSGTDDRSEGSAA
jgi:GGDEF domain-containing protein